MRAVTSVVIVNWNGLTQLRECLDSLEQCAQPIEVIVVDNGSTDGSIEYLKQCSSIAVVSNDRNVGYAQANNQGIARAKGEYVLLLNNDTRVTQNFLEPLLSMMADPSIGGCQSKMLTYGTPPRVDAYGSYLTSSGFLYHFRYGQFDVPAEPPFEIFAAKGAAFLIRKKALDIVGAFDPDFFAYMEDSDLSWKLWLNGWRVVCVPESVVYHKGAATSSTLPKEFVMFHATKNRLCMLIKNLSVPSLVRILPIHLFFCIGLMAIYLARLQPAEARGIARALGWNVLNLADTMRKRRTVQDSIRTVSDVVLWPQIARTVRYSYYYFLLTGLHRYQDESGSLLPASPSPAKLSDRSP